MGLHWACEGTVAMRLHNLTRHKVFAGPAVQIVMDVSEAANGGQILLTEVRGALLPQLCTHDGCLDVLLSVNIACVMLLTWHQTIWQAVMLPQAAVHEEEQGSSLLALGCVPWPLSFFAITTSCCDHITLQDAVAKLTEDMSQAGFPVIRLMGMYQLPSVPSPVFLFGVTEIVGKPLNRQFSGLRKIKQVWPAPSALVRGALHRQCRKLHADAQRLIIAAHTHMVRVCSNNKHTRLPAAYVSVSLDHSWYVCVVDTSLCLCCWCWLQLPSILEFNISAPPLPNENDSLVFVCLRLCTYPKKQKCSLPKLMAAKFMEVFATSAQQFKGYMFQVSEKAFQEVGPTEGILGHVTHSCRRCFCGLGHAITRS
jgi:hypothetical protein